ncbi:MarR family winged helix-turn-helix transcriptional regulator [Pararhizobium mangrovi]|uniref:MarR family transcriptional regulator n=1 Tax=Pararhizobium mangrovi TaxID=2590452 RepID=A0A506UBW0_9HYPH|nr:MarR family transcriptional regulator [Pararhizobium mangrovi]TPW30611.1 MarR family transcriptional regulator [Pararhizobium mangrovi]
MPKLLEEADRSAAIYRLEDQAGYMLRQANQRHVAIFGEHVGYKLTPTQWSALVRLKELAPCSQNQLGRETAMDIATVKGVVDRLVKRGLVRTAQDPNDGRRVVLSLSEEGEKTVQEMIPAATTATSETLSPLTTGERMLFLEMLHKLC